MLVPFSSHFCPDPETLKVGSQVVFASTKLSVLEPLTGMPGCAVRRR